MIHRNNDRLDRAIAEAFAANRHYYRVFFNMDADQTLGPPALEQDVRRFESQLGWPLPPSYRAFLLRHDGWRNFRGDAHLLSIGQRDEPGMQAHLAEFQSLAGDEALGVIVIMAGEASGTLAYLDPKCRRPNGEMDVVEYAYADGELARRSDFIAFLEEWTATRLRLIARETGQAPSPPVEE
jgi:hypothetical protein